MRNQSGCFMMWGYSPKDNSTETYDVQEYHEQNDFSFFLRNLLSYHNQRKRGVLFNNIRQYLFEKRIPRKEIWSTFKKS
jgi:hypothetical protein